MARFTKSVIEFHCDRGPAVAAVNVKIHWYWHHQRTETLLAQVEAAEGLPGFADWAQAQQDIDPNEGWWSAAISDAWDRLEADLIEEQVFPFPIQLRSQGRSGGWAVVERRQPGAFTREAVHGWGAIEVSRWGRFAKLARAIADHVPYQFLSLIAINVYQPILEQRERSAAALIAAFGTPTPTEAQAADALLGVD